MRTSSSRRAGFTLVEALVVMGALTIALGLGVMLLVTAMKSDFVSATSLRQLSWRGDLADQFRGDVARAVAVPDRLDDLARSPSCLILRLADGAHVIYQWKDERLERIGRKDGIETRRPLPVGSPEVVVEFEHSAGDRPLVTIRLIETPLHGPARRMEVSAALEGDGR